MKAFSLIETVVALGLAALVLSLTGRIMADYGRLSRASRSQEEIVEVAQAGLHWLRRELRRAQSWDAPAFGAHGAEVSWTTRSDTPEAWLQVDDGEWKPAASTRSYQARVENRQLVCRCGSETLMLGAEIVSLEARHPNLDLLELRLQVAAPRGNRFLSTKVVQP